MTRASCGPLSDTDSRESHADPEGCSPKRFPENIPNIFRGSDQRVPKPKGTSLGIVPGLSYSRILGFLGEEGGGGGG